LLARRRWRLHRFLKGLENRGADFGPTVRNSDGRISIIDAKGDVSRVTIPDVNQSNGVIYVVNTVLMNG
jgi:uncharacterized surface protein with fasciclin (FAS1) repeats